MAGRRLTGAEAAARLAAAAVVSPHRPRREWNPEPPAGRHLEQIILFCPACQMRGVRSELAWVTLAAGMLVGLVAPDAVRPGDDPLPCGRCHEQHRIRIVWLRPPA